MFPSAPLKQKAGELGFVVAGIAPASVQPETAFVFHERIDLGMYDGLSWFTHVRADRATSPAHSLGGAMSVVTLAAPYKTEYVPDEPALGLRGRVARYAWGRDYHRVLERRLKELIEFIEAEYGATSRGLVDYGPLAERAYAARAGIGWFGKNTNLLLPGFGSWVLLAELITTVEFAPDAPLKKSCGSCTRCITACPTGAISGPYVVDNRLCISFQTIENRGWIPRNMRPLIGDWVFGCDICQDVCPVGGSSTSATMLEFAPSTLDAALPELTALLTLTEAEFLARFKGRAIMRAKRHGLARNACVVLGNLRNPAAIPALARSLHADPSPIVRGHAAWALGRIGGIEARAVLQAALPIEADTVVRAEVTAALIEAPAAPCKSASAEQVAWLAGPWRRIPVAPVSVIQAPRTVAGG